jgi:uncharacterized small protein (DUF1192 family)
MNVNRVNAAAKTISTAMKQGKKLPTGLAIALEDCCLLQSPEVAEEMAALRARVAELEAERHTTNEALSDAAEALRTSRDRVAELEADSATLNALYAAGVDNWDGYAIACEAL